MSSLPDYANRKQLVQAYGWELGGWPADPALSDKAVLLWRWEDKDGNVIPAPPTVECTPPRAGVRQHVITERGEHEVFLHVPYYGTIAEWGELLFADMMRRRIVRG